MGTIAIIQARMGSTRLPGKVLLDLGGAPMLARVVHRAKRARRIDEIVIAITDLAADDVLERLCAERGWLCFRGNESDVLDRYCRAARMFRAEVIVRITSDCPLIDPGVIDQVVAAYQTAPSVDYASNTLPPRTFPRGLDTEVFGMDVLERLERLDSNPVTREHVTLFLHRNLTSFRTRAVTHTTDLSRMRWTVDTPEDLEFARKIYSHFQSDDFSWQDALHAVAQHPDWQAINAHIEQKVSP